MCFSDDDIIGIVNGDGVCDDYDYMILDDIREAVEAERMEEEIRKEAEDEEEELQERYENYLREHNLDELDLDIDTYEQDIDSEF